MHVFLAGASGVVGRNVVPLLIAAGHTVTGTSRSPQALAALRSQGADAVQVDMLDAGQVAVAVSAAAPDLVLHELTALAGGSPQDNAELRKTGTRNLVTAALDAGVQRIVAQSISWAYEPGDVPAVESVPLDITAPAPRTTSIEGVVALESAVSELPSHLVLRYGTLYGPGTWYQPGDLMAKKLAAGELPANDGVSSFVHVADAARATVQALHWPDGVLNIVDDEPAPAREWVPVLAEVNGLPAPTSVEGRAGWERGAVNDAARALGLHLDYPSWRQGLLEAS